MKKQANKFPLQRFSLPLLFILLLGFWIRIFKLDSHMMFIGDFAWFYFSAKKMIETGIIPLVGIETSQTWLHQGPLWTYLIAPILSITNNPLGVGYFSVAIGTIAIFAVYKVVAEMFSKGSGLIAAFLFATSPLVIIFSRMPYHTSPIPLVTVLVVWFSYRWVKYGWSYFPFVVSMTAVLYNFELATVVVIPVLFFLGFYVIKKHGSRELFSLKTVLQTLLFAGIPLLPIIIYDFQNGFLQTLKFAHWSIYLRVIKPLFEQKGMQFDVLSNAQYYFENFRRLIFLQDSKIAFVILLFVLGYLAFRLLKQIKLSMSEQIMWFFTIIPFIFFLINKTQSDAYLPILFAPVVIIFSHTLFILFRKKNVFLFVLVALIGFVNVTSLIKVHFLMETPGGYGLTYEKRLEAVEQIKNNAQGKRIEITSGAYNLSNITLPYEYLLVRDGFLFGQDPEEQFEIYELLDTVDVQYKNKSNQ